MIKEAAYWITLAHLPKWGNSKINNLIIKFYHENEISISEFFELSEDELKNKYLLDQVQISDIQNAKNDIPNNAFLAESLYNQGFEIIPIVSPEYSKVLKKNLKATYSPPILYIKGNKNLLNRNSIAIVGSRAANDISLKFTDNIAKKATKENKVVVSGFAKGIDKKALDSALYYDGESIIVLPQGIMTFTSGFKNYYKKILESKVLVVSTFHPKASWSVGLAMARNPIIYGLANDIYVAESAEKGGTWSGVVDGLKKKREIFVRIPEINEKNANIELIKMGAIGIDNYGEVVSIDHINLKSEDELLIEALHILLKNKPLTSKEIIEKLNLNYSSQKLTNKLKKIESILIIKDKGKNFFKLKEEGSSDQIKLF